MKINKQDNGIALSKPKNVHDRGNSKSEGTGIVSSIKKRGLELELGEEDSIFSLTMLFFRKPFSVAGRFSEKKYSSLQFKKDAIFSLVMLFFSKTF